MPTGRLVDVPADVDADQGGTLTSGRPLQGTPGSVTPTTAPTVPVTIFTDLGVVPPNISYVVPLLLDRPSNSPTTVDSQAGRETSVPGTDQG